MSALVYQAINSVAAELAEKGIAKNQRNEEGDYAYRGIDDVTKTLAPLLAQHKLCILPRVLERIVVRCSRTSHQVTIRAAFDLVSALDGSTHAIETFGEALDDSDKGTAKAMSAAYKSAMLQAFCIPVLQEDADAASRRPNGKTVNGVAIAEPPEGWDGWSGEVIDIAEACETAEAIDRLTSTRRPMLSALQRSRPELYAKVGKAMADRLSEFQRRINAEVKQDAGPVQQRKTLAQSHRLGDEARRDSDTQVQNDEPAPASVKCKRLKKTHDASATAEAA